MVIILLRLFNGFVIVGYVYVVFNKYLLVVVFFFLLLILFIEIIEV